MTSEMQQVTFTIDGQTVTVPKGTTVYHAAKQLGIEIPIFCYHDRMPPFGACRQCLVEVEKMPKLQTSCTLEATEGMVVKTQASSAVDGRKGILEFLLINHPLDCPICDRGGECPLQDQALKYGPGESRFYEEKRHFEKRKALGPLLVLDRERCVVCARCTRFGDVVAGDHALEFIERGFRTEVGTPDGKPVESKFIGNTIMICPVGALTSNVYRFRARPWDNDATETTCTLCPVGCSMILDSRDGEVMRTRSKENRAVNDVWLCDKGWFGYEFTSHPDRLATPLIRRALALEPATWEEALSLIASKIQEAKPSGKIAGLGGNPLTTEENYLFQKLMRQAIGVPHVDHRVGMPILDLDQEGAAPGMETAIGDCANLGFAVLLGLDLTEEFPVIWLRLKNAINEGAKVLFIGHYAPEIAPHLHKSVLHAPGGEVEALRSQLEEIRSLAASGKPGALLVGRQYLASTQRKAILAELFALRNAHSNLTLDILEGRGNSIGARLAGMHPALGPLGERLATPGLNAVELIERTAKEGWKALYVAGADPATHFPSKMWNEARGKLDFLVVQDLFLTQTARQADVILPALSFAEKEGTFVNIEGRTGKLKQGKALPEGLLSDGEIFQRLAEKLGFTLTVDSFFTNALKPGRLPLSRPDQITAGARAPTANGLHATFAPALFDHGVRMKRNPHLIQQVKDARVRLHTHDAQPLGLEDGDRVRIKANGSSISAKVRVDDRVAPGTVVLPLGFKAIPVWELGPHLLNGTAVALEKE